MNSTHEQTKCSCRKRPIMIGVSLLGVVVLMGLTIFMLVSLRGTGPRQAHAESIDGGAKMAEKSPESEPSYQETTTDQCVLSTAGQASPSRTTVLKEQEADRIRQLDIELTKLDSDATERRQKIDVWYTEAHARLKRWAEQRQKELDNAERAAYVWCMQQMQNTRSVTQRDLSANGYAYSSGYVSPYGQLYGNGGASAQGRSSETTDTYVVGDPAGQYHAALIQIRQARQAIAQEFAKLQSQRQRYLDELENSTQRKRDGIELKRRQAQNDTQRALRGGPPLTLQAVGIASNQKPFAMIDSRFVYEGDVVNGYKVRKIEPGSQKVEVESNGQIFVLP